MTHAGTREKDRDPRQRGRGDGELCETIAVLATIASLAEWVRFPTSDTVSAAAVGEGDGAAVAVTGGGVAAIDCAVLVAVVRQWQQWTRAATSFGVVAAVAPPSSSTTAVASAAADDGGMVVDVSDELGDVGEGEGGRKDTGNTDGMADTDGASAADDAHVAAVADASTRAVGINGPTVVPVFRRFPLVYRAARWKLCLGMLLTPHSTMETHRYTSLRIAASLAMLSVVRLEERSVQSTSALRWLRPLQYVTLCARLWEVVTRWVLCPRRVSNRTIAHRTFTKRSDGPRCCRWKRDGRCRRTFWHWGCCVAWLTYMVGVLQSVWFTC